MEQLAALTEQENLVFDGVDKEAAAKLAKDALTDKHHVKAVKPLPSRKMPEAGSPDRLLCGSL